MKIEYVCHSCLFVETGGKKIVMDPWFSGSAYCDQWHLFPPPVHTKMLMDSDYILISHGHQDHLHRQSLEALPKNAHVFYPYLWQAGIQPFLEELGYSKITEAVSYKKHKLAPDVHVTFLTTSMDTTMVIESEGKVLVNLNDSLNAHHPNVVKLFTDEIKKHWKKIDYLFLGLGGAGYFPNTVHYKTKDDFEIGKIREQLLVHQFCELITNLNPEIVLPFTPGFAVLKNNKRWINEVKFPREELMDYYKKYFNDSPNFEMLNMYPGDRLYDGMLEKKSSYHAQLKNHSLIHIIDEIYRDEIIKANKIDVANEKIGEEILFKLRTYVPQTAKVFTPEILHNVNFAVRVSDLSNNNYFNIEYHEKDFSIYRSNELTTGKKILITTTTRLLNYSLDDEWGGDVFISGYNNDVDILDASAIEQNLDIACVRLLTRYPVASATMKREPLRAVKYLYTNPVLTKLSLKQKLFAPKILNRISYNERNHWLNKTTCEVCQACDLPLLSYELGERLR